MSASLEYDLVRLGARARLTGERAELFEERVRSDPDWSTVVRIASYHRLLPLLAPNLHPFASDVVPESVMDALQRHIRSEVCYVLLLSTEMARLGPVLDDRGVAHLVLKGPSLTEAYGTTSKRPFVDNDVLIRRRDYHTTSSILSDLGFSYLERKRHVLRGYLAIHGEASFSRRVGGLISTVDLHVDIAPFGYSYHENFDALYSRSRPVTIAGYTARALSWSDLFLALCVNALKDQWNRLRLASDLAEIAPFVEDWDAMERRARDLRSLRVLYIGVLVAADLVGGDFPPGLVARARTDPRVASVADQIKSHLELSDPSQPLDPSERAQLVLNAQDGVRGQLQYLSYVALRRLTERYIDPAGWAANRDREAARLKRRGETEG